MTTSRLHRRLTRASAVAAGALLTVLALAAPAFADDQVATSLAGVPGSTCAGPFLGYLRPPGPCFS